jgi:hypothetical protein
MNSDMKKYAVIGSVFLTIILLSSCTEKTGENKVVKTEVIEKQENNNNSNNINENKFIENNEEENIEQIIIVKSE